MSNNIKYALIPIYGTQQVATAIASSPQGPVAKINGCWYSVNGNIQEIVDVRYALSSQEAQALNLN